jgi:hypothetical protein
MVLGAFLLGYYLGAKSEQNTLDELVDSVKTITSSDEFRGLVGGAVGMAGEFVRSLAADGRAGEMVDKMASRGLRAV